MVKLGERKPSVVTYGSRSAPSSSPRRYRFVAVKRGITVLVGALLLGGCGGGSDSTGTSSADFVAAADKICKEDNAKFRALPPPTSSDPRGYLAKILPLLDQDLAKLKDLTPPSDDA